MLQGGGNASHSGSRTTGTDHSFYVKEKKKEKTSEKTSKGATSSYSVEEREKKSHHPVDHREKQRDLFSETLNQIKERKGANGQSVE